LDLVPEAGGGAEFLVQGDEGIADGAAGIGGLVHSVLQGDEGAPQDIMEFVVAEAGQRDGGIGGN
jgi:hypothetical protein